MILDDIVESTRVRVEKAKEKLSLDSLITLTKDIKANDLFPFEKALKSSDVSFICEVKKASPSKGIIADDFSYIKIAKEYEEAGASCISVLTEPDYFLGQDRYLSEIKDNVNIPILRKDFIIDEYQIYESKLLGADCILLICSILTREQLIYYLELCDKLQISALVEAHNEEEVKLAVLVGARMIGVNNRNLKDFSVNMANSLALRELVPRDILFISESGIKTPEDILLCKRANVNGVLFGETLMKSGDKRKMLEDLKSLLD